VITHGKTNALFLGHDVVRQISVGFNQKPGKYLGSEDERESELILELLEGARSERKFSA
jgi:hypothetical protein